MQGIVTVLVKLPWSVITPARKNATIGSVKWMGAIVKNAHQVAFCP